MVDKLSQTVPLEYPIRRIFYLSHEGTHHEHEVTPPTNTQVGAPGVSVPWRVFSCTAARLLHPKPTALIDDDIGCIPWSLGLLAALHPHCVP